MPYKYLYNNSNNKCLKTQEKVHRYKCNRVDTNQHVPCMQI